MTTTATPSLSQKLKDGTWDLHATAEKQPFQQNLLKGAITKDAYANWLSQMLLIHTALETKLRELTAKDPRVAAIVTDEQYQEPYLLADLADLSYDKPASPLNSTAALIKAIEDAGASIKALAYHYVLEGSNNGNCYIARAVRPSLRIEHGKGDQYLDPYGDNQRAVWAAFKTEIDKQEFTETEHTAMLEAAREMFQAISDLSAELPSE